MPSCARLRLGEKFLYEPIQGATVKPTVVITNWVQDAVLERLRQHCTVIANQTTQPWSRDVWQSNLGQADAVIAFMPDRLDAAVLELAPSLKLVSCCLKGFDNFDIEACSKRGVLVTILPDLLTEPGAELAIGFMVAGGRHLLAADQYVRSGAFKGWRPSFYGTGLAQSTVGLVGFGAVGRAIAQRLGGFRSTVLYWDRRRADAEDETRLGVTFCELDHLLRTSDFIVLALTLTAETRHFMNTDCLRAVKPGAILINFARGSLVDETAVAQALQQGHLGFYAADVFEFEDWALPDRPRQVDPALLAMTDRTLFTPHLGSAVHRVREEMAMQAADNVLRFFSGELPPGALNPHVMQKDSV
jgi:phosphonate dehydrogenase